MRLSIFTLILAIGIMACTIDASHQTEVNKKSVDLQIIGNGIIKFDDNIMPISELDSKIAKLNNDTIIQFRIHDNATMGDVTDIQKILRHEGVFKINYRNHLLPAIN